jgi:hypothetical protein
MEQRESWVSGAHVPDAVLVDGVVHKTAGPWTPAVFSLPSHLEETRICPPTPSVPDHPVDHGVSGLIIALAWNKFRK